MIDWEKYEDEYEDLYDQPRCKKITKQKRNESEGKKKEKRPRHQSKQDLWEEFLEQDTENFENSMMKEVKQIKKTTLQKNSYQEEKPAYEAPKQQNMQNVSRSEEFVRTIKNVQIDFKGVLEMQKVQNNHNGNETYGIKFLFKSKNNTFRIIWFNQNIRERDAVFNTEFGFWKSIVDKK
jgi:hypothetical protein